MRGSRDEGLDCSGWAALTGNGGVGWSGSLDVGFIEGGNLPCDVTRPIICVQQ